MTIFLFKQNETFNLNRKFLGCWFSKKELQNHMVAKNILEMGKVQEKVCGEGSW